MARTIMVVVDPRTVEPQPVIERAAWLAARVGAWIELFACDFDADVDRGLTGTLLPSPGVKQTVLETHRQRLEALAEPLRRRGLAVTVDVRWDYPLGEAILRKAADAQPWLVAKDTFHNNLLQRTLLSNVDWELIRDCPVPLLLTKPRALGEPPKVMVAVDPLKEHDKPEQLDDKLFEFGKELASSLAGELHLVHAVTTPLGLDLPPEAMALIDKENAAAMSEFLAKHDVPPGNVHVLRGLAHDCLQRAAIDTNADFMVMGAVVRRGLRRLIGSTAARALDRLPCDLIIIKPASPAPEGK